MEHKEFMARAKKQAKKDGVELLSPRESFEKIGNQIEKIYENAGEDASKERDDDIKNYNETLYLLYGIAIGILGSILI